MAAQDSRFTGSIPAIYDARLGPLFFIPYAQDLVERVAKCNPSRVLEVACGTGIVTEQLRAKLPSAVPIIATDLNQAMLDHALKVRPNLSNVELRTADALALPFENASFDHVVIQFGLMFFPDKVKAMTEVLRVLRPNGLVTLNVWDSLAENPIARIGQLVVEKFIPNNTPKFLSTPFGYFDRAELKRVFTEAGFTDFSLEIVKMVGVSQSCSHAAEGVLCGSPLHTAIIEAGVKDTKQLINEMIAELEKLGGDHPMKLPMQAIVVQGRRPN